MSDYDNNEQITTQQDNYDAVTTPENGSTTRGGY
jgi:hypothetical protein